MKLISLDKAIRILVEHHGDRRLRDTLGAIVTYHARQVRQSKAPVRIFVTGAGVNVKQADPRIADCERAVREALGF